MTDRKTLKENIEICISECEEEGKEKAKLTKFKYEELSEVEKLVNELGYEDISIRESSVGENHLAINDCENEKSYTVIVWDIKEAL